MKDCKINILGTEYNIYFVDAFPERLKEYEEDSSGLFIGANREIFVKTFTTDKELTREGIEGVVKKATRHEILHAFLYESGLSYDALTHFDAWPENEEMVDWFAIQSPKIFAVYVKLGLIDSPVADSQLGQADQPEGDPQCQST